MSVYLNRSGHVNLTAQDDSLLLHRNCGDLNPRIVDQGRGLNRGTGWLGIGHHALVNLVHVGEFMDVGEIDGYIDNVFHLETSGLRDLLNILKCRGRLATNPSCGHCPRSIRTLLARYAQSSSYEDPIAERKSPGVGEIHRFLFLTVSTLPRHAHG